MATANPLAKANAVKKTRARRPSKLAEALVSVSGETPLEHILGVMRDPKNPASMRFDAAKAAAPYVHPKLASIEHKGQIELGFAEKLVKARERLGKT